MRLLLSVEISWMSTLTSLFVCKSFDISNKLVWKRPVMLWFGLLCCWHCDLNNKRDIIAVGASEHALLVQSKGSTYFSFMEAGAGLLGSP